MAIGKLPEAEDAGYGDDGGESVGGLFADINITPLTDVFLVMVIIFMVSALAVQAQARKETSAAKQVQQKVEENKRSGLKVNLPSGTAQEIDPTKASLVLVVPTAGDIQVNGKGISDTDIDNLFRAAFARDKGTQVVLQADRGVSHGRVVDLMERAKAAGLVKLAIGTSAGAGGK
jgi:biopolymer transport protein ExbD